MTIDQILEVIETRTRLARQALARGHTEVARTHYRRVVTLVTKRLRDNGEELVDTAREF